MTSRLTRPVSPTYQDALAAHNAIVRRVFSSVGTPQHALAVAMLHASCAALTKLREEHLS